MIKVTNKVVFLAKSTGAIDKEFTKSSNVQGKLKKKVIRVSKLKIKEDIKVKLTGSYKAYKIEVEPADSKHAPKIRALLKMETKK